MVDVAPSNTESDAELKTRAMQFILDRICTKYLEKNDPTFSQEEVEEKLKGLGPKYVRLNIKDISPKIVVGLKEEILPPIQCSCMPLGHH
jgi:hypothetical protein